GADVLLVMSPTLPSLPLLNIETSCRKHMTQLNLDTPADAEKLHKLVGGAVVFKFLPSYRLGSLAARGFVSKSAPRCAQG
ncbi:hypothetical protein BJY52DRAFT_1127387, partial [Lactarius psammicola]